MSDFVVNWTDAAGVAKQTSINQSDNTPNPSLPVVLLLHGGVGDRCSEARCEGVLSGVVQMVLVFEEDHLVSQQRFSDVCDGGGVEIAGQLHAVDAGTDAAAQLGHGHCHGSECRRMTTLGSSDGSQVIARATP